MTLLDRRLFRQVPRVRRLMVMSGVLSAAQSLAVLAQAMVLAQLIVRVFQDRWDLSQASELLEWLALVVAARVALGWAAETMAARASARARSDMRRGLLSAVALGGPAVTHDLEPAELAVLASKGLDSLDVYFSKVLPMLTVAAVVPVSALAVIGWNDRLSLGIIAATLPLVPFFMVLVGKETQLHTRKQWQSMSRLAGHLLDVVTGLVTLHIFGRAEGQAESLRRSGDDYRVRTMKVLRISFLSTLVLELLSTLSIALVAVSIGLRLVEGRMTLVAGLTVLLLAPEVYQPLRNIGTQFHAAADGLTAAAKALDVIESAQCLREGEHDSVIPDDCDGVTVELDRLSFSYGESALLVGLTACFEERRVYQIRGGSGAGKTTLLNIILGFLSPSAGSVRVCGVDARTIDAHWWRAQVAYVPQRPWLPRGTVRDALLMVSARATDEQMIEVLAGAGLPIDDPALPLGLDTPLFDSASGVSAGQMRRIALARALLLRRPVLLADEPTAGLDDNAAARVAATLRRYAESGAIVVVVTHADIFNEVSDTVIDVEAALV